MNRRDMLARLITGAAAAGVTASAVEAAIDVADVTQTDARLARVMATTDPAILCRALIELSGDGPFTLADFCRRACLYRNRASRARQSAKRRERHAGNEVLFRGPVRLWQQFTGRECRSVARHRVLVGVTDIEYAITGIGVPRPLDAIVVRDDDTGHPVAVEGERATRTVVIPAGARVLIDLRRGMHAVMIAEVVRTADGRTRLHLWWRDGLYQDDETTPQLRGGVVYESPTSERAVGILGLPL